MEKYKYFFSIEPTSNPIMIADSKVIICEDILLIPDEVDDKDTQILFSSVHLNELTNPVEIWCRGESLRLLYLGMNILLRGYFYSTAKPQFYFKFSHLHTVEGNRITPNTIDEVVPMNPFSNIKTTKSKDIFSVLIQLAKENKDVLAILLQFGNGTSWINLYSILDTLKFYSGERKIEIIKTANLNSEIHAFTGIANNFGLLGIEARHGETGKDIPKKSITHEEAFITIIKLARNYFNLAYKFNFSLDLNLPKEEDLSKMEFNIEF